MNTFPLFLRLRPEHAIVVIGGGDIAYAKIETLLSHHIPLRVYARAITPRLQALLNRHGVPYSECDYQPAQLEAAALVIAATDDTVLNARIHDDAHGRGLLVNAVDQPELCDVIFPALVRRGNLQVAISSGGVSPVLARLVKYWIERALPWNLERLMRFAQTRRSAVKAQLQGIQAKRLFWQRLFEGPLAEEVYEGNDARAQALFDEALQAAPGKTLPTENAWGTGMAALYLIGAGPGHPELITVKAARLLSQADVVLYDRLVAPELLTQYVRREAEKIPVGKSRDVHLKSQEAIDALIEQHLRAGEVVVRLKGGDPGVFAHGAEEIAIAQKLGLPYQLVPGISAANGCAAYAGIPLTERGGANGVRFLTLYSEQLHDETFWQSLRYARQETLVFYMSSKHRDILCQRLLEAGLDPDTPMLAVSQGTTPAQQEWAAPLGVFAKRFAGLAFPSPTLLIVGDVVRWRETHGWKQQAQTAVSFFPPADEVAYALH